jgi:Peptidase M50B-like
MRGAKGVAEGEIDRYEAVDTDQLSHSVAIHEGGHALVALALGESFKQISTEPRMDGRVETLGHIELENAKYERDAQLGPGDCAQSSGS